MPIQVNVGQEIEITVVDDTYRDGARMAETVRARLVTITTWATGAAVIVSGAASAWFSDSTYIVATTQVLTYYWAAILGFYFGRT